MTKPGEQSASTNYDQSQPETSAALNDAEVPDTDEPGNKLRDALTKPAQEQPNVIEDRNEERRSECRVG